jgi:hypothetical protein
VTSPPGLVRDEAIDELCDDVQDAIDGLRETIQELADRRRRPVRSDARVIDLRDRRFGKAHSCPADCSCACHGAAIPVA